MRRKHSLIIGGTRGIGRALVRALAGKGRNVSVIGKHAPEKKDLKMPRVHYWTTNLLSQKNIEKVLTRIISRNGKLDNVVFFQRYRGTGDKWKNDIGISLTATKHIIEHLIDKFDVQGERSIAIVSSLLSRYVGSEQPVSYHVVKAALEQMARFYAVSLGHQMIRVNGVSLGTILKEESQNFYIKNKKLYDFYKAIIPLGRMGTSKNIADVIMFLCSNKASFITGQTIIVDGGVSLQSQESLARQLTPFRDLNVVRQSRKGSI